MKLVLDKQVIKNMFYLNIVHGVNILSPLLTIPIIISTLGYEGLGYITYLQTIVGYASLAVDYGFDVTAVKDISQAHNDEALRSKIFCDVLNTKLILFVSLYVLSLPFFMLPGLSGYFIDFSLTYLLVLGQSLFPIWMFQGMQNMKYITYINLITKSVPLVLIFLFINKDYGIQIVLSAYSLGWVLAGLIGLFIVLKTYKITYHWITLNQFKSELTKGVYLFLSKISVTFYTSANIIILRAMLDDTAVGYYNTANKIALAFASLGSPLVSAVYPSLSQSYKENYTAYKKLVVKYFFAITSVFAVLASIVFVWAGSFVYLLAHEVNQEVLELLRILSLTVFFTVFGSYFTHLLVIHNKNKVLLRVVLAASALSLCVIYPFISNWGAKGMAWVTCLTLFFVMVTKGIYLYRLLHDQSTATPHPV